MRERHTYEALVLSLLFYGSECWILSAQMRDKIVRFHRCCLRFMCGVNLESMRNKNLHHWDLEKRLRILNILLILESRRLQWLRHVNRMPQSRLPQRLLSSWIVTQRPKGRPCLTYGHGLVYNFRTHCLTHQVKNSGINLIELTLSVYYDNKYNHHHSESPLS